MISSPLEDLLDQVRDALIGGNLAALPGLSERIEGLATNLGTLDRPAAQRLHRKADRNARLLSAASRGIKAARQRLTEISNSVQLSTYDAKGRRELLQTPSHLELRRV